MDNTALPFDSYRDGFWPFLAEYLPDYYTRNDVLEDDILFRFLTDDEVCEEDFRWIEESFHGDKELVRQRLVELETGLAREALSARVHERLSAREAECTGARDNEWGLTRTLSSHSSLSLHFNIERDEKNERGKAEAFQAGAF